MYQGCGVFTEVMLVVKYKCYCVVISILILHPYLIIA